MNKKVNDTLLKKYANRALVIGKLAITPEGIVGNNRKPPPCLPWDRLEGDLKRFKEQTLGHVVMMGRTTCEILYRLMKKPFEGRTNVVLSNNPDWYPPSNPNWDKKLRYDKFKALSTAIQYFEFRNEKIFLISPSLVRQALDQNLLDELILTETYESYPGDVTMENLVSPDWKKHVDEYPEFGYNEVHYFIRGHVHK